MASPAVNVGTGTTLTFGSVFSGTPSTSVYEITNVSWDGISCGDVPTSHMGITASPATFGGMDYIPGDLVDPGTLTVEGHFQPSLTPPIEVAAGVLTLAFAGAGSWAATTTSAGTAICTGFSVGVPFEDKMSFSATFKLSGGIDITAG